jgi:hypothetical protein
VSEARWCDSCGRTYSALDERARRMNIEEQVKEGARMVTQVIQRDACGDCMDKLNGRPSTVAIESGTVDSGV